MGGALRKTMVYLGLAEDEERYDAYDADDDLVEDPVEDFRGDRLPERHVERQDMERPEEHRAPVTPIGRGPVARVLPSPSTSVELHRISTIHPRTYNEAKTIAKNMFTVERMMDLPNRVIFLEDYDMRVAPALVATRSKPRDLLRTT